VQKIRQKTTIKDYFDVSQGYIPYRRSDLVQTFGKEKGDEIVDQRLWHSDRRVTDDYKEEIWGEGLSRYDYRGSGSFVKYGEHLATYVDEKFFTGPRLLIREITNPNIIGCLVEEEFVNDPQIISVIKKNCGYSLEALWVIINSKLSTFFHFNSSPKATKGAFPKILVGDVNDFPLPPVGKGETIAALERLVREVRAKKVKTPDSNTSKLEKQMDQLVYNFYGLNSDDISKVESS